MDFKKIAPHLIALVSMMLLAAVFFAPNAFDDKVLSQSDNVQARGMQTEIKHYIETEGKNPLWTNSAFGGMPAFQIYAPVKGNLTTPIYKTLFLWTDYTAAWAQLFVAMFCMYLLLIVLGADWRVGIFGAIAFSITSYNVDILEAGHSTKMAALALSPGVLAGAVLLFNRRMLLGGGLMALFIAMQLYANHVQITYYTLLLAGIYILAQLADAVRHKTFVNWGKALLISGLAIAIGFASNLSRLWTTYEYGQETIRGASELESKSSKGDGLDKEYLFLWSYGIGESLTLLVPHASGGAANETISSGKFYDQYSRGASPAEKEQIGRQVARTMYWGGQPLPGTAIYFGAIVCFLFTIGAFLVRGNVKWWLLTGGIFMITLAWGKYFFLNDFLYAYFPMFNKFRAVTMALGPGQLCFAVLAAMGLQKLFDADISADKKMRALYWGAGITAFLCLVVIIMGGGEGANDAKLAEQIKMPNLSQVLIEDRSALARSDAFRSLIFIALAAALIWMGLKGRLKAGITVLAIALLALVDHWQICRRTLTSDNFQSKRAVMATPKEEDYDLQIKQDKDIDYRVLDLARGGITGNAVTSYFHKSLSGYHAAKMQRYQEVVDRYLGDSLGRSLHIVGMFNGKYVVLPKGDVLPNPEACGNAWFVKQYDVLPDGDAELNALRTLKPKEKAVLQQSQATALQGLAIQPDSTASIRLSSYHPDQMVYEYSANSDQLAVFSEIYYPPAKGWKCFLNGQPAPDFFKVNYLLRGMRLPAGQNVKLEMRFEPRSYYLGETVAYAASALTLLVFLGALFLWYRGRPALDPNRLTDIQAAEKERPARVAPAAAKGKMKKK